MTTSAANEEVLGTLHQKVATVMVRALEQIEVAQDKFDEAVAEGPAEDAVLIRPDVSPALLSAMTKFLADNKITCNPAESKAQSALEERLRNKGKRRSVGNVVPFQSDDD